MCIEKNFRNQIDVDTFTNLLYFYGASYEDGSIHSSYVSNLLNEHIIKKEHIFKLFGEKLKVEKEIETTIDINTAIDYVEEFTKKYLSEKPKRFFVNSLFETVDITDLMTNNLTRKIEFFDVSLKVGTKISTAIAKLCADEDVYELTTAYSMLLQKMRGKGKVVISIDPIDYITMSSNASGWKSCHRLNGGEFRTGPLAYLADSSTVICYIESSTPCKVRYNNKILTHSNKCWRQIALVSPDLTFAYQERQYPNVNIINENAVSELFKDLFEKYNKKDYIVENIEVYELELLHTDYCCKTGSNELYYNDTLNEMFDSANIIYPKDLPRSDLKNCKLPLKGETAYCLNCECELDSSSSLYCCECRGEDY
ncbi:MAG: hypothetical protein HUJ68_00355 [Clostridia bacterium]|nr:hypothetical protein [Clostridia bacterium]